MVTKDQKHNPEQNKIGDFVSVAQGMAAYAAQELSGSDAVPVEQLISNQVSHIDFLLHELEQAKAVNSSTKVRDLREELTTAYLLSALQQDPKNENVV